MGVDIDEAGGDEFALGVDFLGAACGDVTDRGDAVANNTDIGVARGAARTVDDGAATDYHIECGHGGSSCE